MAEELAQIWIFGPFVFFSGKEEQIVLELKGTNILARRLADATWGV